MKSLWLVRNLQLLSSITKIIPVFPLSSSLKLLLLAAIVFLVAGTIKGLIRIGLPTITISLMSQSVGPRVSIALLLIPALFTSAWHIYRAGQWQRSLRALWPFCVVMMVTMYISSQFALLATIRWYLALVVSWLLTSFINDK